MFVTKMPRRQTRQLSGYSSLTVGEAGGCNGTASFMTRLRLLQARSHNWMRSSISRFCQYGAISTSKLQIKQLVGRANDYLCAENVFQHHWHLTIHELDDLRVLCNETGSHFSFPSFQLPLGSHSFNFQRKYFLASQLIERTARLNDRYKPLVFSADTNHLSIPPECSASTVFASSTPSDMDGS